MPKLTVDVIYNMLPEIVRREDAKIDLYDESKNKPLYRFLQILVEGGIRPLEKDIEEFLDLFDVDKCPDKYLPLLASILGFEFPFDLNPRIQRRFIKHIPKVYRRKGTKSATEFIIRDLLDFDVSITAEYPEIRRFEISFVVPEGADEETQILENKARQLLDIYKVANSEYILSISYSYSEVFRNNFPLDEFDEYEIDAGQLEQSSFNITESIMEVIDEESGEEIFTLNVANVYLNMFDGFKLNTLDGFVLNHIEGSYEDCYDKVL